MTSDLQLNMFIFGQVIAILSLKGKNIFFLKIFSLQEYFNNSVNFQNFVLMVTDRPLEIPMAY